MSVLLIDDAVKAEVKRVLDFALRPENIYETTKTDTRLKIPGENPQHVAQLNSFRVVFSITKAVDGTFRHLSISLPNNPKRVADPYIAFTIAELFGFTGWNKRAVIPPPRDWQMRADEESHCVVIVQPISKP